MAVRKPLKYDAGNLRPMTDSEIADIQQQVIHEYASNPSVSLSVVSSGGNLSYPLQDTRVISGQVCQKTYNAWPDYGRTTEPEVISGGWYDRINQNIASIALSVDYLPLYITATGDLRRMSSTDVLDTFAPDSIITDLTSGSYSSTNQGGTYFISTSTSVSGATRVSSTPVFIDTISDPQGFIASGLWNIPAEGEVVDYYDTINYYLHKVNGPSDQSLEYPVYWNTGDSSMKRIPDADFKNMLQHIIRYKATRTSNGIRYSFGGSGSNRGTLIKDTRYVLTSGGGVPDGYQVWYQFSSNDYRAVEITGAYYDDDFSEISVATISSAYLRIYKN